MIYHFGSYLNMHILSYYTMRGHLLPFVFLFSFALLVPGAALGNTAPNDLEGPADNYSDGNKLEPDFDELPNEMQQNIETNETIHDAEKIISNEMERAAESEFDVIQIPFTSVSKSDDAVHVSIDPLL